MESLMAVGLKPIIPKGSYFIVVDISNLQVPDSKSLATHQIDHRHDFNVCR